MASIPNSTLERIRFACQGWGPVFNDNMDRLENTLLKLSNLYDVDITRFGGLADKDVLAWDHTNSLWHNMRSGFLTTTTTTTT